MTNLTATPTSKVLEMVFGSQSQGTTPEERAKTSSVRFVRSQDLLAFDSPEARGSRYTAWGALEAFGWERLLKVLDESSCVLPVASDEPATTLLRRRNELGLTQETVARQSHLTVAEVAAAENPLVRSSILKLNRIASVLDLDERLLSVKPGAGGDSALAVRLRTLGEEPQYSQNTVAILAEAAWIITTQQRLQASLKARRQISFKPSPDYGAQNRPAWQAGYDLADATRKRLSYFPDDSIASLRDLCGRLQIPLVRAELPKTIAGATVSSGGVRGVIVNTRGANRNVWVQRMTIAHELGHLLWDSEPRLGALKVDGYSNIHSNKQYWDNVIEARANAFAVELLAPTLAVRQEMSRYHVPSEGIRAVMERFGVSATTATYHAGNATGQNFANNSKLQSELDTQPSDEWIGRERYTEDQFPLTQTPLMRLGQFAGYVVHAQQEQILTPETAAEYLMTDLENYRSAASEIASLFPLNYS